MVGWTRHDTTMVLISVAGGLAIYAINYLIEQNSAAYGAWFKKHIGPKVKRFSSLEALLGYKVDNEVRDEKRYMVATLETEIHPNYKKRSRK